MWEDEVEKKAAELEDQMEDVEDDQNTVHKKTID
jgi:hypothetical protein